MKVTRRQLYETVNKFLGSVHILPQEIRDTMSVYAHRHTICNHRVAFPQRKHDRSGTLTGKCSTRPCTCCPGCSWRQLPQEYGAWHTLYVRFQRWSESGVMDKVLHELQRKKVIGVRAVFLDSTIVRAHHTAAGARRKRGRKV